MRPPTPPGPTGGPSVAEGGGTPRLAVVAGGAIDFRALFLEHYDFVYRALAHFGMPQASLDDATQEVFAVVHRRLADYDGRTAMRGWLWGIARNVASSMQRGEQRARRRLELVADAEPVAGPDETLAQRQQIALARACLEALDEQQREVFVLAELEGFSAPEIAQTLDVKLNTVYSRLRIAREKFQRALARARTRAQRGHHG
ncbi:MAG: sigma-70 family RNA polymerase sigma factor [Nannocystaceae bacterium]|nr:sigma-70 family RNA polymerase sigma factor [Nannocystaceae bacterium]